MSKAGTTKLQIALIVIIAVFAVSFLSCGSSNAAFAFDARYAADTLENNVYGFADGDGSKDKPFIIKTAEQLDNVREYAARTVYPEGDANQRIASGYYFKLANDIDLTAFLSEGGAGYNGGLGWKPIAKWATPRGDSVFCGYFDGGGFTVSGLWIDRENENYIGLFGSCYKAEIRNLNVKIDTKGIVGNVFVGGIAGGLAGDESSENPTSAVISGCSVVGNLKANGLGTSLWQSCAGGIAGIVEIGTIKNCHYSGEVSGAMCIGGIAGETMVGVVQDCLVEGAIVVAGNENDAAKIRAGGIVGNATFATVLTNCVFLGVSDLNTAAVIGHNCWVFFGGLMPLEAPPSMSGCFYDAGKAEVTLTFLEEDEYIAQDCRGLTSEEMRLKESFVGFDFTSIWGFDKDGGIVLRAFGKAYDAPYNNDALGGDDEPDLLWLWILIGCLASAAAVLTFAILYHRRKVARVKGIEIVKEIETVREIEIVKEVETIKEIEIVKEIEVVKEVPVYNGEPLPMDIFTPKEKRVAEFLLLGKSRKDIAAELGISEATAKMHTENILSKTECESQRAFVAKFLNDNFNY